MLIWPYLALFTYISPYLPIFTTIYQNLAVFRLNCPYLGIFALNFPDFTICARFTLYMYSSIETAPLCKILECSIGPLFMGHGDIAFQRLGEYKCRQRMQFGC